MSNDTITAEQCTQLVETALAAIESAQVQLAQAVVALSNVPGMADELHRVCELRAKVKAGGERLNARRDGFQSFIRRRDARKGVAHA